MAKYDQRPSALWAILALLLCLGPVSATSADEPAEEGFRRLTASRVAMGKTFQMIVYAPADKVDAAEVAMSAALDRIQELDGILSDYDLRSELSRLSETAGAGKDVKVSDPLWRVLEHSQQLAEQSDGAFDVTVGPLTKLWRRARRQRELPPSDRLQEALAAVGHRHVQLDPEQRTVRLLRSGMRLDLGGIGVGFALDEALAVLRQRGFERALLDGSGDILAGEPPPNRPGWRIGIAPLQPDGPPSEYVSLKNAAIATSGDAFQHVVLDGRRYSHLVDPRTGLGLSTMAAVTVLAPDAITADSLASAINVLGVERGLKLAAGTPCVAVVYAEGNEQGQATVHRQGTMPRNEE